MATNDVSRRTSAPSGAEYSLVDPANAVKGASKKDINAGKVRLKKLPSKPKLKDGETVAGKPATRSPSPDSPLINELDGELRSTFPTGRPMEDTPEMIQCKHCKKPMLKSVAASHIKLCLQKKQERLQKRKENKEAARKAREARDKAEAAAAAVAAAAKDDDDSTAGGNEAPGGQVDGEDAKPKTSKKAAVKATAVDNKAAGKKRKAGEGAEGEKEPKKKKTKKELEAAKAKVPKLKQPVDVEKQCGVPLPNGLLCARSLTCKTHSMGAKKNVPGRSLPYPMLLQQYQKRNQAKQQRLAMDANAPLPDEIDPAGPVDSDEEKDLVMAAVARSCPRPLEQHIYIPVKKKYAYIRMKEMLGQALGGRGMFGGGGVQAGGGMGGTQSNDGVGGVEVPERRGSVMSVGGGNAARVMGGGGQSRKASVVGVGAG